MVFYSIQNSWSFWYWLNKPWGGKSRLGCPSRYKCSKVPIRSSIHTHPIFMIVERYDLKLGFLQKLVLWCRVMRGNPCNSLSMMQIQDNRSRGRYGSTVSSSEWVCLWRIQFPTPSGRPCLCHYLWTWFLLAAVGNSLASCTLTVTQNL